MMKKILIALIFVVMLGSCMSKGNTPSIFSDRVCGKSCWNSIVVGETDKQEFLKVISTFPTVDQASISSKDLGAGGLFDEEIIFQFYRIPENKNSLVRITARFNQGKIVLMIFQGELGLTFQELIDIFGAPDFASSLWTFDGGINVHVINSVQGVEANQYFKSEKSSITLDTEINNLYLFDPDQYQTYLESDFLTGDYKGFILYPWTGYGKIEDMYWPPR
jgi:hypothetical protein